MVEIQSRESGVPTIVIRIATRQDLPQLGDLVRQEVEYQQTLARSFELIPQVDWAGYVSATFRDHSTEILVAEQDDHLVGYIVVRIIQASPCTLREWFTAVVRRYLRRKQRKVGRIGIIEDIYIVSTLREHGVATRLLQSSLQWFQSQHAAEIQAAIWTTNKVSLSFAHKSGFEPFKLVMSKRLQ